MTKYNIYLVNAHKGINSVANCSKLRLICAATRGGAQSGAEEPMVPADPRHCCAWARDKCRQETPVLQAIKLFISTLLNHTQERCLHCNTTVEMASRDPGQTRMNL